MVGGLGALGSLGSLAGGFTSGLDAEARRRLLQQQADFEAQKQNFEALKQKQEQQGQTDAGSALAKAYGIPTVPQSSVPGAQPMDGLLQRLMGGGGQQQPQPQPQGPAPMPPMGRGGPPPMGMQPQQQPQPQMGGSQIPPQLQRAAQVLDYPTLFKALKQMPDMTPQRLMGVLNVLQPFMSAQNQQAHQQLMDKVAVGGLGVKKQQADQQGDNIKSEIKAREDRNILAGKKLEQSGKAVVLAEQRFKGIDFAKDRASAQHALDTVGRQLQQAETDLNNEQLRTDDPQQEINRKAIQGRVDKLRGLFDKAQTKVDDMPDTWEGSAGGRAQPLTATPLGSPRGRPTEITSGGVKYKYKGTGDYDDQASWEPVK